MADAPVLPAAAFTPREMHRHATRTPLGRRRFLVGTLAGTAGLAAAGLTVPARATAGSLPADPFTLGVASGDPTPTAVVIWTRLAPAPLEPFGRMPDAPVEVEWQVRSGRRVVRSGTVLARPELAHSVHVDVTGLDPAREYSYRFRAGGWVSRQGRTRTTPAPGAEVRSFTLAVANCQDWQNGYYAGYRDLARNPTDLVLHVGDYIYEYDPDDGAVRAHNPPATPGLDQLVTLTDYRTRHALYKTDPDLQAAHAAAPWTVVWDDHEVENNYAGLVDEETSGPGFQDPDAFARQRAAAYQAWYEHMPVRGPVTPGSPELRVHRRVDVGRLLRLHALDTRQYRTDQPPGFFADFGLVSSGRANAAGTMTGAEQEAWLVDGLRSSQAVWNVVGQQVIFTATPFLGALANLDQWDGYDPQRRRLLAVLAGADGGPAVRNPVVLTGDIHSTWVNDVKADFDDPASPTIGAEFVAPSISSEFPEVLGPVVQLTNALPNEQVRYFNGFLHGYLRCTVTPQRWTTEVRSTPFVENPDAFVVTSSRWVVEDGRPGAQRA
jgi:alkaline phosphatase D